MEKRRLGWGVLVLALLMLWGCAANPYDGDAKTGSDALLARQFEVAAQSRAAKPEGRILFAGFAMHSQSKAFRGDVSLAEKRVLAMDPNAVVFKLSNPVLGQEADWPYATPENMEQVLARLSAMARPGDKVVLMLSTHGNVDVLAVNINNKDYPYVNAKVLNQWLSGLRGKSTLLVLSACYSGSFLQALSGPSRVILTAAAKDRSSFGCQFQSTNTYFVDALLNQANWQDRSIVQLMEEAQTNVAKKERDEKLSPPSLPQVSVGMAARGWANQALKNWVESR